MESVQIRPIDFQRPIPRPTLITILNTAIGVGEYRFARQVALSWLASFSGDLLVSYYLAQSLYAEGKYSQAASILDSLCMKDPEFFEAQELRADPKVTVDPGARAVAVGCVIALGGIASEQTQAPEWSQQLRQARQAIQAGMLSDAEEWIQQALLSNPPTPLPAIMHVEVTHKKGDRAAVQNMADVYHMRWSECLQFSLYLAEARMKMGDDNASVALLHHCVAYDAAGQVPSRVWGVDHPYRPIWPEKMLCYLDIPIPASVAGTFGWNQLASGVPVPEYAPAEKSPHGLDGSRAVDPKASILSSEAIRSIQEEFERLAQRLRRPGVGSADGRFPVYVILSTRNGLEKQYGPQTTSVIDAELRSLMELIRKRPNWGSLIFYADDPACTSTYGIKPAVASDPGKIKAAITSLDKALAKKGEMIGAMLVVGGPQVVPFHRLSNPTDDDDRQVASDSPYACLDESCFIPEWPIGRLPGGSTSDPGLLLSCLRKIAENHTGYSRPTSWWRRSWLFGWAAKSKDPILPSSNGSVRMRPSFGYTASVWKKSSAAVFRPISENQSLLVSPPAKSGIVPKSVLAPAYLSYFNLHGLEDTAEWYGQRDVSDRVDGPDYPIAVSPADVLNHGHAPRIVFTEACYGANIDNKGEEDSLALKFLSSGTLVLVGSTCISYGSVTTPLIAADLLGHTFWKRLREGMSAGEAFQQAKIFLVQEMHKRQGYLDGEDQKTLLSFVLYGDPLTTYHVKGVPAKSAYLRIPAQKTLKTICDIPSGCDLADDVPHEMAAKVKKVVDKYLPGLEDAEFYVSQMHAVTSAVYPGTGKKSSIFSRGMDAPRYPQRTQVTLSKQVNFSNHTHRHIARLTLDKHGKMVKLAVSR